MTTKRCTAKQLYIISALVVFSLGVTWIDAVVQPSYFTKIPIKIVCFLLLPLLFFAVWRTEFAQFKRLFRFEPKGLLISLLLGGAIYVLITGGYYLTGFLFDFSAVTANLTSGMGITADNFVYVALYITLFNSFLEEFFFRGFGFITLKNYVNRSIAYCISPVLFAIYHVGMTFGSFHPLLLGLMMLGLIAGGVIFNALNEKFGNIYPSWFVHMAADAAIMTVGAALFGLI